MPSSVNAVVKVASAARWKTTTIHICSQDHTTFDCITHDFCATFKCGCRSKGGERVAKVQMA